MQGNNQDALALYAEKARLILTGPPELLSAGMVGVIRVQFSFSEDWDGLEKTAVFTNGTRTVNVPEDQWDGMLCTVPGEVLAAAGKTVMAGVYGTNGLHLSLPTVWCVLGRVEPAADLSGEPAAADSSSDLIRRINALESSYEADHSRLLGMVPRAQQAEKTPAHTVPVSIDENGALWIRPDGMKTLAATRVSDTYTYYGSDFQFSTVDDIIQMGENGQQIRLAILGRNDVYFLTHVSGAASTARLYFTGISFANGMTSPTVDVFEIDNLLGIRLAASVDLEHIQPFEVNLSYSSGAFTCDQTLPAIQAAIDAGRWMVITTPDGNRAWVYSKTAGSVVFQSLDDSDGGSTYQLKLYTFDGNGITQASYEIVGSAPVKTAVAGTTPVIAALPDVIYVCGEVASLTVSSIPASGEFTLVFTSGSTATTLTLPQTLTGRMPSGFAVEANTRYEINVSDGWPVIASWAVSASA